PGWTGTDGAFNYIPNLRNAALRGTWLRTAMPSLRYLPRRNLGSGLAGGCLCRSGAVRISNYFRLFSNLETWKRVDCQTATSGSLASPCQSLTVHACHV